MYVYKTNKYTCIGYNELVRIPSAAVRVRMFGAVDAGRVRAATHSSISSEFPIERPIGTLMSVRRTLALTPFPLDTFSYMIKSCKAYEACMLIGLINYTILPTNELVHNGVRWV